MDTLLPIIPISQLQRGAKHALEHVSDYAVVRSHHRDVAFVLHPDLGRILLQSGMLDELRRRARPNGLAGRARPNGLAGRARPNGNASMMATEKELEQLIGSVLRELSKK